MPNWSQLSGVTERVITAVVMFAVAKGWITGADAANITALIVGILAAVYAYYVNRPTNLVKQAASVKDTTVVTNQDIANNVTNPNVLSNNNVKVQTK